MMRVVSKNTVTYEIIEFEYETYRRYKNGEWWREKPLEDTWVKVTKGRQIGKRFSKQELEEKYQSRRSK